MDPKQIISFFLNGEKQTIDFGRHDAPSPYLSLLSYLREAHHLHSVKEGCGGGDCGACTVVMARTDSQGNLICKAVNACLVLLPMAHDYHIITTEYLHKQGKLHPLQAAFIKHHASQCGFCTPGLIMAALPLYNQKEVLTDTQLRKKLAGNLCRCTGYQPILQAIHECLQQPQEDDLDLETLGMGHHLDERQKDVDIKILSNGGSTYYKVFSSADALALKAGLPQAKILAGGTDLFLRLKDDLDAAPEIIDITAVEDWKHIRHCADGVEIGCMTSLEEILQELSASFPAFCSMLEQFASVQIRNMASLGGNIAHASPIGDSLPVLMALGAKVRLADTLTSRTLLLDDFITGYQQTVRAEKEILTHILLPLEEPADAFFRAYKISRRPDVDISTLSAAMLVRCDEQGRVSDIRIYYGGMAAMPRRATLTEASLSGKPLTEERVRMGMQCLQEEFSPISDVRAHAKTRQILAANLLLKFYADYTEQLEGCKETISRRHE